MNTKTADFPPDNAAGHTAFVLGIIWYQFIHKLKPGQKRMNKINFIAIVLTVLLIIGVFGYNIATGGRLT